LKYGFSICFLILLHLIFTSDKVLYLSINNIWRRLCNQTEILPKICETKKTDIHTEHVFYIIA